MALCLVLVHVVFAAALSQPHKTLSNGRSEEVSAFRVHADRF